MAKAIPIEIQQQANKIIEQFNLQKLKGKVRYAPRFKGAFLYLDRADYSSPPSEICRLKYTGSLDNLEFATFKHSTDRLLLTSGFFQAWPS